MDKTKNAADARTEWDRAVRAVRSDRWMPGDGAGDARELHRVAGEIALRAQQRGHPMPVLAKLRAALDDMIVEPWHRMPRELLRDAVAEVDLFFTELDAAPGTVPLPPAEPPRCDVQRTSPKTATVREGSTTILIQGPRRVWLLLQVVEAAGKSLTWSELLKADVANAAEVQDRRSTARGASRAQAIEEASRHGAVQMATGEATLQNLGARIRRELGKLSYHWHQDGTGVTWSVECQ